MEFIKNKNMKKTIELTKLDPNMRYDEVINYLLDNGMDSIVDDTMECVEVVYLWDELYYMWNELRKQINIQNEKL
jgi:hypothetical protein